MHIFMTDAEFMDWNSIRIDEETKNICVRENMWQFVSWEEKAGCGTQTLVGNPKTHQNWPSSNSNCKHYVTFQKRMLKLCTLQLSYNHLLAKQMFNLIILFTRN